MNCRRQHLACHFLSKQMRGVTTKARRSAGRDVRVTVPLPHTEKLIALHPKIPSTAGFPKQFFPFIF